MSRKKAEIEAELAMKQAELEALKVELENAEDRWPKIITTYVNRNKEDNCALATENKLNLSEEAFDRFIYTLYELEIKLAVQKDGSAYIVEVGGEKIHGQLLAN